MRVIFYNKDGESFTDNLQAVDTYNGNVYWAATAEHITCAKREVDELEKEKFYVKKCTTGANGGHFADPYGALSKPDDFTKYDSMSARRHYEYTPVSKTIFDQYLTFLFTRNPSYLRNAERDYNNTAKETYAHASR